MPLEGREEAAEPNRDGNRSFLGRLFRRLTESDEERLAAEIREWAESVPDSVRITEAPLRKPVRLAGVVRRITIRPMDGSEALEAVLSDGTGEIRAVWTGRRSIPGLSLGTRLVMEGVVAEHRTGRRMVNPTFEFAV
jgi:RecG-like helicase